ncbi:DUF4406 domain-containing protein [Actinomyces sp. B33]|uniref:DUF4406 domain-containing protein n=1 Tax=Actinomyces sp. B33 TaxID=2942131 RepID=UPI0023404BBF|nr:DUF4406 domain-containing protein [Actinomyces sp. B33]MDC4232188.1 DUF4406 domain-containing protein [Actinomyces sp. B33]
MTYAVISQPMRGIEPDRVRTARQTAEAELTAAGYDILPDAYDTTFQYTDEPDETITNPALWHMGKALMRLSHAEVIYMCPGWSKARGCRIEHSAAIEFGLTILGYEE